MPLLDHLPTDGMMIGLSVNSKKQLLEHISAHAGSLTKVPARAVFDALIKRERLGSTGIGGGMAIPHAVFAELMQSVVIITTLETAVAFDARDKKPVDIVCTILGPDQADCDHLKLVSAAAKYLANGASVRRCVAPKQHQTSDSVLININPPRHRYFISIAGRKVFAGLRKIGNSSPANLSPWLSVTPGNGGDVTMPSRRTKCVSSPTNRNEKARR